MIDHDFTEKHYLITYYEWMDILSSIGGYNASIGPMLNLLVPLFILNFLFQLSKLIHGKNKDNYHQELHVLHSDYRSVFEKIQINEQDGLSDDQKRFVKEFALQTEN